jgi:hypothetical protein
MRVTAIWAQTPRKRLDSSVRRAEKRRCEARKLRVHDPIRPILGACEAAATARGGKNLPSGQTQEIVTSDGRQLGECRLRGRLGQLGYLQKPNCQQPL